MADLIIGLIVVAIIGAASAYIYKEKKRGTKCIGCPAAGNCPSQKGKQSVCNCGCQSNTENK